MKFDNNFLFLCRYCNSTLANYGFSVQSAIRNYLPGKFQPHMLCAGIEDMTCDGGSGGSLVIFNTKGFQYTIIGMPARGIASNCNNQDHPEMFIRLDHPEVMEFILSNADELNTPSATTTTTTTRPTTTTTRTTTTTTTRKTTKTARRTTASPSRRNTQTTTKSPRKTKSSTLSTSNLTL